MGGTSFDIGLVPEGGVKHYDFQPTIDRWLVSVPMIHLLTLGAGGGSIASYDRIYNAVKIGPESAGSDPGPACYDRGGLRPTVTDADLLLGYLDPDNYANGYIKLNPKRSVSPSRRTICDDLDMDVIEVAKDIKNAVDEQMAIGMAKELRVRGYLPEDFTMLAYGGNGPCTPAASPTHAGISRILAPPFSSVFSACGAGNMKQMHFHERGAHVVMYNATDRQPATTELQRIQHDRRGARAPRHARTWCVRDSHADGRRLPPRNGHALRKPVGDHGRRVRHQPR